MNDTDKNAGHGSAAASLGAHSKDADKGNRPSMSDTAQDYAHQAREGLERAGEKAREGMERAGEKARDMAGSAREAVATQGARAADHAQQMMRDQPMMTLAITGVTCFALGVLFAGRR
jgi:ElaB/YqjD/DUF883 family membrane-anchored ribosome-binding protein